MGEGRFRGKLMPKVLLIGGTDSSGAGLVADIETIINLGGTPNYYFLDYRTDKRRASEIHAVELDIF